MKGRSKVLLAATIAATVYVLYLITYFFGGVASSDGTEALAGAFATALVMPHMFMFFLGVIFGWLGVFLKANWAALVAAILYSVGTALFPLYAMFGIPILILGFVGYARQKKKNADKLCK